jgi:hypothetical protein
MTAWVFNAGDAATPMVGIYWSGAASTISKKILCLEMRFTVFERLCRFNFRECCHYSRIDRLMRFDWLYCYPVYRCYCWSLHV